jgi:hypothetical protein
MSRVGSFYTCFPRLALVFAAALLPLSAQSPFERRAALPGHVLPKLREATALPRSLETLQQPLTVTVMLNLSDKAGADELRREMNDPNSVQYHKTITVTEFTERFGPSQEAYDSVLAYLQKNGLTLTAGSANRRTLTVRGTRAQAEHAFGVAINDYKLGNRTFHAVAADPAVPAELAPLIAGISGLSNMGEWRLSNQPSPATPVSTAIAYNGVLTPAGVTNTGGLPPGLNGSGQNIGLIEFDGFDINDTKTWLDFAGLPKSLASQVSTYSIANDGTLTKGGRKPSGCAAPVVPTDPPCNTTEALLDIEAALGIAQGAKVVVLEIPPSADYYNVINSAAGQLASLGGGVLSLSGGVCESEVIDTEKTNVDSLLAGIAITGITFFAATGDTGSTCIGESALPNTIAFPADVPHAIAVGGTILNVKKDNTYQSENYWGLPPGSVLPPGPFGGAGYGVSAFFPLPSYQSGLVAGGTGRSVPDVSIQAVPGINVCQATPTVPKNCPVEQGTSLAAPLWAAVWALAQQAMADKCAGGSTGCLFSPSDGYLYTIPQAFHPASGMAGGEFADLGLGSPDITTLIATAVPPQVDSFNPTGGAASGGTKVTITGGGFIGVQKVTFGGVEATHLTILSDTQLTVDSPAAPDSNATIEVVTAGGKATAAGPYSYYPEIDTVSPNAGPLDGGITVTVTGLALGNASNFEFFSTAGIAAATGVKCSSKSCTMLAPAHAAGTVDIIADTPWGYGNSQPNSKDKFTYQAPAITSFNPMVGPTTGGLLITINGVGLQTGKTTVSFGGSSGTKVSCVGSTLCTVFCPAHAAGNVPLTVTVAGATSAPAASQFRFDQFPTLTGISPSSGAAGSTVIITGTGFSTIAGETTFLFSGTAASGVSCASSSARSATRPVQGPSQPGQMQCTAIVPPPPAGFVSKSYVTVTVNGDTSLKSLDFTYTDVPPPPPCKGPTCN